MTAPEWTTAEWAQVIAAVSAAIAAVAASAAVALTLLHQKRAIRPNLSAGVTHGRPSGRLGASFANGGPGVAVQVSYMLVHGDVMRFGLVNEGHLAPTEKAMLDFGTIGQADTPTYFIWSCSDVNWNVYIWSIHWQSRRFSRRRWLKRDSRDIRDMFQLMYPNVTIPSQ